MKTPSSTSTLDSTSPLDAEPFLNILKFPGHEPTYLFNPLEFHFQEDIHANSNCVVKSYLFKPYNNFHVVVKAIQIPHSRNIIQKGQNEKRLKQLIDEVRNFRRLPQHPYIVDFYGFCRHEGQARIVMEHMDLSLEELYTYVHGYNQILPKIPEDIIGVIAHRILDALAFCKEHNIIHRDVKPRNVLLTLNGNVKLCDFGESRVLQDSLASTFVGTVWYWPPERFGKDSLENTHFDVRADIWSLGITLGEVANGSLPFPHRERIKKDNLIQIQQLILQVNPVELVERCFSQYSHPLRDFVLACLEKDVQLRPKYAQLKETEFYQLYANKKMAINDGNLAKFMEPIRNGTQMEAPTPIAEFQSENNLENFQES